MKARQAVLVAIATAVALTSVAAASTAATKQRVAIDMRFHASTFVLSPFAVGALKHDSGTMSIIVHGSCREVVRGGQKPSICGNRWRLTCKQGALTIQTHEEWVDPGSGGCGAAFRHLESRERDGRLRRGVRRRPERLRRALLEVVCAPRGLPHDSVAG
jgi:hypothetical protein